jgi:hypothetical protein
MSQDCQEDLIAKDTGGGHCGKMTLRYAVKHLNIPSLLQESPMPNRFAKAAMDLACDAEMFLRLAHPNIVKLRGWATRELAKIQGMEAYQLLLDYLWID